MEPSAMREVHAWVTVGMDGLRVMPDPIRVPHGQFRIVWEILWPDDAAFEGAGIEILYRGKPFGDPQGGGKMVSVQDDNTMGPRSPRQDGRYTVEGYKYVIKVRSGGKLHALDPAIENENC